MIKRTLTLLALASTATCLTASTANAAGPAAAKTTERTARFLITNNTDSTLGLAAQRLFSSSDSWREVPGDIPSHVTGDYTAMAFGALKDVGAEMTYDIVGTDYSVKLWATNPGLDYNDGSCDVELNGSVAKKAPFQCRIKEGSNDSYNDANFLVTIAPAATGR